MIDKIRRGAVYREFKYTEKYEKNKIFGFLDFEAIFEYYMVSRRSGRYLETFLEPVASL